MEKLWKLMEEMNVEKNDLFDYGLKIYQYKNKFKFSLDSILLAEFVENKLGVNTIVDFCTGNAPVPLILSTRFNCKIIGFEVQNEVAKIAEASVSLNNLDDRIKIVNANLKDAMEYVLPESVDVVTCNPPYFKKNDTSLINEDYGKAVARHEIMTNLDEIVMTSSYILKNKGCLYMVHRPERLEEIILILNKYHFVLKSICYIYAGLNKKAIMVLIKAVKNGQHGLIVYPPLNVLDYKSYKHIFEGDNK